VKLLDFEQVNFSVNEEFSLPENHYNVILINTNFDIKDIYNTSLIGQNLQNQIQEQIQEFLKICFNALKNGGLIFIYCIPKYLILYGNVLNELKNSKSKFLFKYWIALDINDLPRKDTLKPSHMGLLMYLKTRNTKSTSPFYLNTKSIRVPYSNCQFCRRNVKDWGGKKHLMNPLGACLSDVWKDLPRISLENYIIPEIVKNRIIEFTKFQDDKEFKFLYITEKENFIKDILESTEDILENQLNEFELNNNDKIEKNIIVGQDCIQYLKDLKKKHPEGVFDFFFADPPYNLDKDYSNYNDDLKDKEYILWCEEWLKYGIRNLKPGGALFILNLPKWTIYHAKFLLKHLQFRHWIIWDAMSTPAGKIMPAHYSLLYFTKPNSSITFNYESKEEEDLLSPIESDIYCLRGSCIKERKKKGHDKKLPLTDIWWDIHRIKHKKDRDIHPCQLPLKLMKRIINMTTNPGDLVYDPFSGSGSTSICAKILGRNYISTEIDEEYVEISNNNLNNIIVKNNEKILKRKSVKKAKINHPKRNIEITYINLCKSYDKVISKEELKKINPTLLNKIEKYYPSFKTLKKIANRRMEFSIELEDKKKEFKEITEFL